MPDIRPREPILIAGGGIAGLSAAITLGRAGRSVRVLERLESPPDAGAGLQLGPNATRLLRQWGVLDRLEGLVRPVEIRLRDGRSGARRATVPLGAEAEARYGAPYAVLHRRDLLRGLLATARAQGDVEIVTGFPVARARPEAGAVEVTAADSRTMRGPALIAADGLFSTLRPLVAPGARTDFAGRTAWRALIPADAFPHAVDPPHVGLWLGPGAHLVHYPVRGGTMINLVAVVRDDWRGEDWNARGDAARLRPHFADWAPEALALLEAAPDWRRWALFRMAPLRRWSRECVVLIGDAAHPVLPYLAQGAALAIEDAGALAHALARTPDDPASAFARLAATRHARAARVQRAARTMGAIYQMRAPLAWARDGVLRLRSPRALLDGFDWLYGYDTDVTSARPRRWGRRAAGR